MDPQWYSVSEGYIKGSEIIFQQLLIQENFLLNDI